MSTINDIYALSDEAVCRLLGERIRDLRLRKNIPQETLAHRSQLSVGTVKALERGHGKILNLIAVLRELGALDDVDAFIPPTTISPLELARSQGRQRKQASGGRGRRARHPDEDTQ